MKNIDSNLEIKFKFDFKSAFNILNEQMASYMIGV